VTPDSPARPIGRDAWQEATTVAGLLTNFVTAGASALDAGE
jgi:hypothetical protein